MTGGVSKNSGIVRAMEAKLGEPVLVPEEPQTVGALGAALFAQEGVTKC
jgi:activator of 2-hydroxyglutaryl-CoA dehydratase